MSLPQLNHDLNPDRAQVFETGPDTATGVRIPGPRLPAEDAARGHLHLAPRVPEMVRDSVRESLGLPTRRQESPWVSDLPVALLAALVVGLAAQLPILFVSAVLAVWAPAALHAGKALGAPGTSAWRGLVAAASPPVAVAGLVAAAVGTSHAVVGPAALMVVVATMCVVIQRSLRATGPVRAVIIGDRAGIAEAAAHWQAHRQVRLVGACSAEPDPDGLLPGQFDDVTWVHGADLLGALVDDTEADLVLVAPGATGAGLREVTWQLEGRPVRLAVLGPFDSVAPHRLAATSFAGSTLVHVAPSCPSAVARQMKGALDRCAGLALLLVAAPVLAALAVLIRVDTPGAALFRQTRVGHNGRPFTMFKLRTMTDDAEARRAALEADNEVDGNLFKIRDDPRITKVGGVLRRLSLDELPQLINVVRGEMSLIGPRPALPHEVAEYDATARRRLVVKPGITGLWQVSGRSDLSYAEAVRLDVHYADNWRISDDAVIMLRTVGAVARRNGAY